jgi:hypothetical protein
VHKKHNYKDNPKDDKRFDKSKDEVALLICFLFDHFVEWTYLKKNVCMMTLTQIIIEKSYKLNR